ncbi:paerucumarin biosynthesis protein PvcA [Kitasatospora paracochleata]|uniref:Pyoverdine/dityrosine biosynthesis protein Dit1 n=1 Tax=Kitasatospora paracochleata TaxID=58354 RepID=A0ABT1IVN5_9ACTN|nr:isocyanide synthase family protein [Kitasatospora paracochleata]MCP2309195.1 pyoverdine/dityrosine biosynthesis protein Dit1 [Kitasatospora paracochleata]
MPPVSTIDPLAATVERTCAAVLDLLLPHRRATDPQPRAVAADFPEQLGQLARFVAAGEEIVFTLPGFPCKSPSPAKVLGHLPDEGERLSLTFLNELCAAVGEVYRPGARMVICSDGHIFGDLIRVPDHHIDAYSDELAAMIRREKLDRLSVFDLRNVLGALPYDEKRAHVHARYAPTVEELRAEARADEGARALYLGITRFLTEDTVDFTGTRSALQRECRRRAYGVIQRSRAWGDLIAEHHPRTVRLSIHPQPRGAAKFGIRLLDAEDAWTTPWHSVVVHRADGGRQLMRRADAEQCGRVVLRDGRPSHFEAG